MSFGSIIRARRLELGIGLNEIAERMEISPAYWSRVEREYENPPSDALIEKVAAILGLLIDDLFVEANRLPPDMKRDIPRVILAYRRMRAFGVR